MQSILLRRAVAPAALILVLCVIVLMIAASYALLERNRQQVEVRAEQTTQNLALILDKELDGNIRTIDLAMLSVIDEYQRLQRAGRFQSRPFNDYVDRVWRRLPFADAIRVADGEGFLRYGTDVDPDRRISIADRSHFKVLLDQTGEEIAISEPQQSRVNNKWVIVFARRINRPDGRFDGVVFVPVPIERLTRTFADIALPKGGSISLRSFDLRLITRYPAPGGVDSLIGQSSVAREFVEALTVDATRGTFRGLTPLDQTERLLSYRRIGGHPLYVVVGLSREEYLAVWKEERNLVVALLAALGVIGVLLLGRVYGAWNQVRLDNLTLARLARTDFLTQLTNRIGFREAAEAEWDRARRYNSHLSILMIDIDHFKYINDTRGHAIGDQALQGLAESLRNLVRRLDVAARWGGEEFVVLLPETDRVGAFELAERIRAGIENAVIETAGEAPVRLTVSIGVATVEPDDVLIDAVINRADDALYRAKNRGRNRICQ